MVPPVYIEVIMAAILSNSLIPEYLKIKKADITATMIEMTPPIKAAMVLGKDLVHSLKSQLNNIRGIAMGTVRF